MAKFESEDANFTVASSEASTTHPFQCGALKKGGLVVLKVCVCVCVCVRACLLACVRV